MESETKECTKCRQAKPLSAYYRRPNGALFAHCKQCHSGYVYARREQVLGRPIQRRDPNATEKQCGRCQRVLPLAAFPTRSDGSGRPRSVCSECKNAQALEYKKANRERIRAAGKVYYQENRDKILGWHKQYRLEHPERYREIHSRWKARNKSAVNAATHRRRNHITANGGHWTATEWEALKAEFDHRCLMCLRQEPEIALTVDHIIPVSKGGPNTIDNIQPLCKSCNSLKHRGIVDLRGGR